MIAKPPRFWWETGASAPALLLAPVARVYGLLAARRLSAPPRSRAPVPVICVGNFVVGGAGKTPTAIALARLAKAKGRAPGILTRGHGGRSRGPLAVDPERHRADDVGDEPLLLAREAPTVVARDRPAGAAMLAGAGIDLVIMDDGFQNPSLAKDISLLVVDAEAGVGNGRIIPAGPLRAPLVLQLQQADAVIVVGGGSGAETTIRAAARMGKPVLAARLHPRPLPEIAATRSLLAYAGIGRPAKFFASLAECGANVAAAIPFPDHHVYSEGDARALLDRADGERLDLITTEKDLARLRDRPGLPGILRDRSTALAVDLIFDNPALIEQVLAEFLTAGARRT